MSSFQFGRKVPPAWFWKMFEAGKVSFGNYAIFNLVREKELDYCDMFSEEGVCRVEFGEWIKYDGGKLYVSSEEPKD